MFLSAVLVTYATHLVTGHLIIISNICIGTMLSLLAVWMYFTGFANVCKLYIIPWLVSVLSFLLLRFA